MLRQRHLGVQQQIIASNLDEEQSIQPDKTIASTENCRIVRIDCKSATNFVAGGSGWRLREVSSLALPQAFWMRRPRELHRSAGKRQQVVARPTDRELIVHDNSNHRSQPPKLRGGRRGLCPRQVQIVVRMLRVWAALQAARTRLPCHSIMRCRDSNMTGAGPRG